MGIRRPWESTIKADRLTIGRPLSTVARSAQSVSHMLALFPFEEEIYRRNNIPVSYVGHPLASVIPMQPDQAAARATLGLTQQDTVVAILPGSRESEIAYLAGHFFQAARLIRQARPATKFLVPMVAARQGSLLATSFHPELSGDDRFHRYFISLIE